MEPEGSLLCLQERSIGPYPEPDQSSLLTLPYLSKIHLNIILTPTYSRSVTNQKLTQSEGKATFFLLSYSSGEDVNSSYIDANLKLMLRSNEHRQLAVITSPIIARCSCVVTSGQCGSKSPTYTKTLREHLHEASLLFIWLAHRPLITRTRIRDPVLVCSAYCQ
jgi:hypothetical protein